MENLSIFREFFSNFLRNLCNYINHSCSNQEPWQIIVYTFTSTCLAGLVVRILSADENWSEKSKKAAFRFVRKIPYVRRKIQKELARTQKMFVKDIHKCDPDKVFFTNLPEIGLSQDAVLDFATNYEKMNNFDFKNGKVSGAVYADDASLVTLDTKIFNLYCWSNPLHADVFPGCRKMEAEVVRMCCTLFHGDENTCGTVTSGGTESILLACLAYKNLALSKGIARPEILAPITAHAAFDKAASLFNMKLTHVSLDTALKVNVFEMRQKVNKNTCMLVASCPNFPHGIIDPIEAIAKIGRKYGIPVHVDACLGGFLVCFMEQGGFELKPFDFRVSGVTSISADTHKYGYTPKGSSVLMYSDKAYLHQQYFCQPNWPGGLYASPTLSGSRSGANVALCWATLLHIGKEEFIVKTRRIIRTTRYITDRLHKIEGITVLGEPEVSVVAFTSYVFDIYAVFDKMTKLGWSLNALQFPSAIHLCVTGKHVKDGIADKFIEDVTSSCRDLLDNPSLTASDGLSAIYGSSQKIPDRSLISEVAYLYLDACYSTKTLD